MDACELNLKADPVGKADIPTARAAQRERGVALYMVLVMLLLVAVVALWAARSSMLSEMVTGNDADYQRAFEAAQAMVQDAKDDIYRNLYATTQSSTRAAPGAMQFPPSQTDFLEWALPLQSAATRCKNAICLRRTGGVNFWDDDTALSAMVAVGARYGQYSGASTATDINPILKQTAANKGAWYWVEAIPFKASEIGDASGLVQGTTGVAVDADMLFHITAIAIGLKGASTNDANIALRSPTMAVIQTLVALPVNKGE